MIISTKGRYALRLMLDLALHNTGAVSYTHLDVYKRQVVYQCDIYTGEQWLEIMPGKASKSNAIKELKEKLKCEK